MFRVFGALASAVALSAPVNTVQPPYHYPTVKQVICPTARGTAFRLGDTVVTAAHVSAKLGCRIGGELFTQEPEGHLDFATLSGLPIGRGMKINCEGFIPGKWYHAAGYANGNPWQTTVTVLATFKKSDHGLRIMMGYPTFIPGMSGGPVMDSDGAVVGMVNTYYPGLPFSGSREMKDTSLCS